MSDKPAIQWWLIARKMQRLTTAMMAVTLLSGCLVSMASVVIEAERARLVDLERFRLEVASHDCAGLSDLYAETTAQGGDLTDLDQRSDIIREAMLRDGCALPAGLE